MDQRAQLERAESLLQLGRNAEAIPLLHQVLAADPDDSTAHVLLSYAHEDTETALHHAQQALALQPNGYAELRAATSAHTRRRERNEAVRLSRRLIANAPHSSDAHRMHSSALIANRVPRKNAISEARNAAATAVKLNPYSAGAWHQSAVVEAIDGNPQAAEKHLRKALEIDPTSTDSRQLLSNLRAQDNKVAPAMELVRSIIAENPADKHASQAFDALLDKVLADLLWLAAPVTIFLCVVLIGWIG